ncbi:hypothetical protein D3C76_1460040 [compost metagenome]
MAQERLQRGARGATTGDAVGVLFGGWPGGGDGEGKGAGFNGGVEFLRAEFLIQEHLLGERLRAKQRAGQAIGGVVEGGLQRWRQDVFATRSVSVAVFTIGQGECAVVAFWQ